LSRRRQVAGRTRLDVEGLEGRIVLAAGIGYDRVSRTVTIVGSTGNDSAEVRQQGANLIVSLNTASGRLSRTVSAATVSRIAFTGDAGNDTFTNLTAIASRADGGAGADVLRGGSAADELIGGEGNDQVFGEGGNDTVNAGAGNDTVDSGAGNDTVDAGAGNDSVRGGLGDDRLMGGDGQDALQGDDGADRIWGGHGNDSINGGAGNDSVFGEDGADSLLGDAGNDTLDGGVGNDAAWGGTGNDLVMGGEGNDQLYGDVGNDSLWGGLENDELSGGAGNDALQGENGNDWFDGGTGSDQLVGGDGLDMEVDTGDRFTDGDTDGDGFDNDYDNFDILYEAPSNPPAYADDASAAPIIAAVDGPVRNFLGISAADSGLRVRVQINDGTVTQPGQWGDRVTGVWRYLTPDKIQVWGKWSYPASDPSQVNLAVQWTYSGPRVTLDQIRSGDTAAYSNPANYSISAESRLYAGFLNGPTTFISWLPNKPANFFYSAPNQQATGFPVPTEALRAALASMPNFRNRGDSFSGDFSTSPGLPGVQPVLDVLRTINRVTRAARPLPSPRP
jgi:Ca2+-binding RTX toxin-like protein